MAPQEVEKGLMVPVWLPLQRASMPAEYIWSCPGSGFREVAVKITRADQQIPLRKSQKQLIQQAPKLSAFVLCVQCVVTGKLIGCNHIDCSHGKVDPDM